VKGILINQKIFYYQQKKLFSCSVRHAFSWKIMQNNIVVLIQDIIYPLLCITDDDIELFNDEPVEFLRARLGMLLFSNMLDL